MPVGEHIFLEHLLTRVAEYRASDLHLNVGMQPVLRVNGKLAVLSDEETLTEERMRAVLHELLTDAQRAQLEQDRNVVLTYALGNKARFKVDVFYQKGFPSISLRYINATIQTVQDLGLPSIVAQFAQQQHGLVIIAGMFGSGRSATLAALIETINRERAEHILTIERPIEYLFLNQQSIIEQREVGRDVRSFREAIENSFQEDVNVVMISELQEPEVIERALTLAQSGRLVLTSMSTETVIKTLERILTAFPADHQEQVRVQLAETLQGIVAQKLLPRTGGGTIAVAEVLTVTPPIRSILRDGAIYQVQTMMQTSREEGMIPFDRALTDKVKAGDIAAEDALAQATDPASIKQMLRSNPAL